MSGELRPKGEAFLEKLRSCRSTSDFLIHVEDYLRDGDGDGDPISAILNALHDEPALRGMLLGTIRHLEGGDID
jgi:hypothetical protein